MQKKFYSPEFIDEVIKRNDIIEIVSSYIQVVQKGGGYWALCPFHHEKTPSFSINRDEQYYHCFGCGEGGNVIKFVQQIESISFIEAVEKLASKAGLETPDLYDFNKIAAEKKIKAEILSALNSAMQIYKQNLYLPVAKKAQEYVKSRNFKKSDLEKFNIGYSNGNTLIKELLGRNFSEEILEKAGLIGRDGNKLYDKLGNRLIFPILNSYAECVGFSGRILIKDSNKAKYKNTEQTLVFDKSTLIYGLNLIKDKKRNENINEIILVEGQIDVIKMHSYGFTSTVASMGTALTEKHAEILKRLCENVIIVYDGDFAGEKATLRAIDILNKFAFNIKIARLPQGKDPDEFLKENGESGMKKLLNDAVTPVEYKLKLLVEKNDLTKPEGKSIYLQKAIDLVKKIKTHSEREIYLKIISKDCGIPIDILRRDCDHSPLEGKKDEGDKVLNLFENGNKKAIKFVLKSILNGETFSRLDIDLKKYLTNPIYISLLNKFEKYKNNYINELNKEEKDIVLEILQENNPGGKEYFDQCVWRIVENDLKIKQTILNEQFKVCKSSQERAEILNKLKVIIKKLNERRI